MEIPFKRVVWNEHEAVLLVDTYEKVRNGVVFRDKALVDLSKRLRNRMALDGIAINERYRNVAGMNLQLLSLERSIDSNGNLVENNKLSQIFRTIYLLSKNERETYNALLSDADLLYPCVYDEMILSDGITNVVHPYEECEPDSNNCLVSEAKDVKYKGKSVDEELSVILTKNFSKGYRLNSTIARKRFVKFYTEEYGKEMEISDEQIDLKISEAGIVYNGMVYVPSSVINEATRQLLFDYIETQFTNGAVCIYYNVLFEYFSQ